jgi:hypothetical protein
MQKSRQSVSVSPAILLVRIWAAAGQVTDEQAEAAKQVMAEKAEAMAEQAKVSSKNRQRQWRNMQRKQNR